MNSEDHREIPDVLFLVLHENGNVIYTHPPMGGKEYSISSLVSAFFTLGEELSGKVRDIVKTTIGHRKIFFQKNEDIIYSLFASKDFKGDFRGLLSSLVSVVKNDFPVEIIEGMVETRGDTSELTKKVKAAIKTYLIPPTLKEDEENLSLPDLCSSLGAENVVRIIRGFLAKKKVVLLNYKEDDFSQVVNTFSSIWPGDVKLAPGVYVNCSEWNEGNTIFVAESEMKEKLKTKVDDAMFVQYGTSTEEKLKGDFLLEKMNEILDGESEEASSHLREELAPLKDILEDTRELIATSKNGINLKKLKSQLTKKHSARRATYVLEVLGSEKSPILEDVETSADPLKDLFLG